MKIETAFVVLLCLGLTSSGMSETTEDGILVEREPGLEVTIEAQEQYSLPGPALVGVVFRNQGEPSVRIPSRCDITHVKMQISFDLEDTRTGKRVSLSRPSPRDFQRNIENPYPVPLVDLAAGEARRTLVDLSEFEAFRLLEPGEYRLTVVVFLHWARIISISKPVVIHVERSGNPAPDLAEAGGNWKAVLFSYGTQLVEETQRLDASTSFYQKWLGVSESLECQLYMPEPVPGFSTPSLTLAEELVMVWECLVLNGELSRAQSLQERIEREAPQVAWRLGEFANRRGFLATAQRIRRSIEFEKRRTRDSGGQ